MKPVELKGTAAPKLSFDDTAREMAAAGEDWSKWEATTIDGLEEVLWEPRALRPLITEMYGE